MKALLSIIALLLPLSSTDKDELFYRIEEEHESFRVDELDNLYLIDGVEIRMWNKAGKQQFTYSKNSLGRISDVDLSRSLKPLVFYSGLSTLVVLDNTLSVQGSPVDLGQHDLDQAVLVCNSVNSNYWFYDGARNELIRTDKSFRKVEQSGNLIRILNMRLDPTHMLEFRENLYLNAPSVGILVFDIFGSHLRTIPIKNADHFQISSDRIHFMRDGDFYHYNRTTHETKKVELPEENVEQVRIGRDRLYLSDGEQVSVYKSTRKELPGEEKKLDPSGER